MNSQGAHSIALGYAAGHSGQQPNSIILNASGGVLNSQTPESFYVKPIRRAPATFQLFYNPTNGEISYN